jgi:hypothetical protein
MFELGWLARAGSTRAVRLTERGKIALLSELDVTMEMKIG